MDLFERMSRQGHARFVASFFDGCHDGRWHIEFRRIWEEADRG